MKKLFFILLSVVSLSAAAQLKIPSGNISVKFSWLPDTTNHRTELYAAILIPVKLEGCAKIFYMQFDLGAHHSLFYGQETKKIITKYPKADTSTFSIAKGNTKNKVIIGTIGEDIIEGKTLLIDYPKQTLTISDSLPVIRIDTVKWSSFMLMKGGILLPAMLNNRQTSLFVDTGSSAFELLTSKATSDLLTDSNAATESYPVNSWGRMMTAHTRVSADGVGIGGQKLAIKAVTYTDSASEGQVQQMLKLGIGGLAGNKLFLNGIWILETKNKKFAIIR